MQTPTCITLSADSLTTNPLMIHTGLSGLQDGREVGVEVGLVVGYDKLSNSKLKNSILISYSKIRTI